MSAYRTGNNYLVRSALKSVQLAHMRTDGEQNGACLGES